MRLKTYTGKTMAEVMERVRRELGPDAIIVNSEQGKKIGGARVTAAYEGEPRPIRPVTTPKTEASPASDATLGNPSGSTSPDGKSPGREFDMAELTAVMSHQGIPYDMAMRLQTAAAALNASSLPEALSAALETCFTFQPIALREARPLILIGPPGAGKTVSTAKLAAEGVINKSRLRVISTDLTKSTGVEHLEGFTHLMKLGVESAETPEQLANLMDQGRGGGQAADLTLIDTTGLNPFNVDELEEMSAMIQAAKAEPIAVMPAGLDPMEAADMAEIFASMGARRLIATRLDTARRFAGILTAAQAGRMAIAGFSRSPYVAQNIETATPLMLGRIIAALPRTRTQPSNRERAAQ